MRTLGMVFLLIGVVWGGVALNLPTTIQVPGQNVGSGEFQVSIPSIEVHNLDLANRRQTQLIMAGLIAIVGSIFIGFGAVASQNHLASGNSPQKPVASDNTSLFQAAENGDFDMAYGLIRDGADVNQKNPEGKTAIDLAQDQGNTRIIELLLSNGASSCCDLSPDMKTTPYKYQGLENYLSSTPSAINEVTLSFEQIETIISDSLPLSAMNYREWWANQSDTSNRPQAKAWTGAGFIVDEVHQMLKDSWVRFKRP